VQDEEHVAGRSRSYGNADGSMRPRRESDLTPALCRFDGATNAPAGWMRLRCVSAPTAAATRQSQRTGPVARVG
jgi:hypothetical protein